jgi:hypothetical protein
MTHETLEAGLEGVHKALSDSPPIQHAHGFKIFFYQTEEKDHS